MTRATAALARDLDALIQGRVLDAGDAEYRGVVEIDNGRVSHEPLVVVVAENEKDVVTTVRYAAKRGVRITVKCGGHGAAGYCLNSEGIVLDLRNLRDMGVDRKSGLLRIGMGLRWRAVYDFMEASQVGRIPIGGGCPDVGVGGFLLGGGYSFVSRSYGLGCDNMPRLRVVDTDGDFHDLSDASTGAERDLYWAMRGGGGGNLGVAVSAEIQTQAPKTPSLLAGQLHFAMHQVDSVLAFYNDWVQTLPREMAVYGFIGHQPDPRRPGERILSLRFTPIYNGPFEKGIKLIQPLVKQRPFALSVYDMTIPEWEDLIGSGTTIKGRSAYIRSLMMRPGAMTSDVGYIFKKYFARCPSMDSFMVWTHAGGAVADVKPTETAFWHREALFVPEIKAIWDRARPEETRQNVEWAHAFFEELAEHSVGAYLNYIDPLLSDWSTKYYGKNYKRLQKIKAHWDPKGIFAFPQGIGSTFSATPGTPLDLSPL